MQGGRAGGLGGALALAACWLGLSAPAALALPPANDDFANAQAVGPLPFSVSESNAGATKEVGEPYHGPFGSKGHSVWFEWEAGSSGYVTVGTCGSDFAAVSSVYTGTKVDALTKVAGESNSQGPGCPSFEGNEVTFKATSGTNYAIAVDGEAFYVPPGEPPVGEGTIELQIEATPVPSNDDFATPTVLSGSIEEEEGAEFASYWASDRGFNWNATKQAGEPDHAGDPGGASVWYRWTAPGSGIAHAAACGPFGLLLGVYAGASVGGLTLVGAQKAACADVSFQASEGTTYRFAVDGEFSSAAGEPNKGSFYVNAYMKLPPRPAARTGPVGVGGESKTPPDTTPPNTTIVKDVLKRKPPVVVFRLGSSEPGSTFRCKLDKRRFARCRSPKRFRHLRPGAHTFRARAVDASGNPDPTPAVAHFRA